MKIRTRLLLILLPAIITSITLISVLLAFRWHSEIMEGFRNRLKSAVVSAAALFDPWKDPQELHRIQKELDLAKLSLIPLSELPTEISPHQVHITPIFSTEDGKQITGYAPVYDKEGHLVGMIAANADAMPVEKKFQASLFLVIASAGIMIVLLIPMLFFIADRIAKPIQKLNNSALAIAAGHYGNAAAVAGPKEIAELANTLNTMSECLLENINRLKENSLLRERMYGEYECAMLLQHLMLQKNIDDCRSDAVAVKSVTFFSDSPRGFLLDFPKGERKEMFPIHLAEAEETGFEGMYELLTRYKQTKVVQHHTSLLFDRSTSMLKMQGPHLPLFWSLDFKQFLEPQEQELHLDSGDFFFLFNEGFLSFFKKDRKLIQDLFAKVLKVFAQDGLETTASMLQKELAFATKRKDLVEDIHLLCFQILNP